MPKITYIQPDGARTDVEVAIGISVMEGALRNGIDGIVAECGGACSCATCHVYVAEEWLDRIPAANSTENSMLEFAEGKADNSRLSCQINVTADLDGLVVTVAEEQ